MKSKTFQIRNASDVEDLIEYNVGLALNSFIDSWAKESGNRSADLLRDLPESTLRLFNQYLIVAQQAKRNLQTKGFFHGK